MCHAIELDKSDQDLHQFVWRQATVRLSHVAGYIWSIGSFHNMSVKQNAIDFAITHPLTFRAVKESFYVACLVLSQWRKSSNYSSSCKISFLIPASCLASGNPVNLLFYNTFYQIYKMLDQYFSSLTLSNAPKPKESNGILFKTISIYVELPSIKDITKRVLISEIAKIFDVLSWFSSTIIKMKILLQHLWEVKIGWNDLVPPQIYETWIQWRHKVKILTFHAVTSPKKLISSQFNIMDFWMLAYSGVVYIRLVDQEENAHISLVIANTQIKGPSIPHLELCGAHLLVNLLSHAKEIFCLTFSEVYAWTDSTIVLNRLVGCFKTYMGNWVPSIMEHLPNELWCHVKGAENPADCASRGIFLSEFTGHNLW